MMISSAIDFQESRTECHLQRPNLVLDCCRVLGTGMGQQRIAAEGVDLELSSFLPVPSRNLLANSLRR